jgi:hypothetical protein
VNIEEQCLQSDSLAALVTGGYHEDRSFQLFANEIQIAFCLIRQFLEAGCALGDFLPTGNLFVNRFAVLQDVQVGDKLFQSFAPVTVSYTDFDLIDTIQYVQLGQGNLGYAVYPE